MSDYISRETMFEFAIPFFDIDLSAKDMFILAEKMEKFLNDIPAADVIAKKDFNDCRNELCLRCGSYRESHLGACDGCRWQAEKWR